MKKILSLIFILVLSLSLTSCLSKKQEAKPQTGAAELSQDDSLEMIEEEINDTELEEFEEEFKALDAEIDQL